MYMTKPLYFDNITRSITVYVPKYIIIYTRPLLYIDNLSKSKSISVYVQKPNYIIKFTPTLYPEPKVIIELCLCTQANEQRLKDSQGYATQIKNKNINKTASYPNSMQSSAFFFSNPLGCVLRCLHWVGGKYSEALRSIRSDFVRLRWEEVSKTSLNINYLNILLLLAHCYTALLKQHPMMWWCSVFIPLF